MMFVSFSALAKEHPLAQDFHQTIRTGAHVPTRTSSLNVRRSRKMPATARRPCRRRWSPWSVACPPNSGGSTGHPHSVPREVPSAVAHPRIHSAHPQRDYLQGRDLGSQVGDRQGGHTQTASQVGDRHSVHTQPALQVDHPLLQVRIIPIFLSRQYRAPGRKWPHGPHRNLATADGFEELARATKAPQTGESRRRLRRLARATKAPQTGRGGVCC